MRRIMGTTLLVFSLLSVSGLLGQPPDGQPPFPFIQDAQQAPAQPGKMEPKQVLPQPRRASDGPMLNLVPARLAGAD